MRKLTLEKRVEHLESLVRKNTFTKNEMFTPGDRVVQLDTPYEATVVECGPLRRIFNKYGDDISNADEFNYELIHEPNLKVCVVQDDDSDLALISCEDLEIVESYNRNRRSKRR